MSSPRLAPRSIGYVIVFVRDMRRSIAFYKDTLGLPAKMESAHWTEFDLGATTLALHGVDDGRGPAPKPLADPAQKKGVAIEVVFTVDDPLDARAALVKAGVVVAPPKHVHDAGPKVGVSCLFEDPDGNLLSAYGLVSADVWKKVSASAG
jgi:catechol 2,3-dioxygenase-like lactoylglutathione lyase family enzyme